MIYVEHIPLGGALMRRGEKMEMWRRGLAVTESKTHSDLSGAKQHQEYPKSLGRNKEVPSPDASAGSGGCIHPSSRLLPAEW